MTKISALPQYTAPTVNDEFAIVDVLNSLTKYIKLSDLMTFISNNLTSVPSGSLLNYGGVSAPAGYLLCYGQTVSRTTYSGLFSALNPALGTATITIASPAVVTLANHGMFTGDSVYLTTTGALPTGLTANTLYYVIKIDANTFNLATSRANAYAATKINTSGSQSGVHTVNASPYGLGDGSTTFTIPDARGRVLAGVDYMGGTAASRLTKAQTQGVYGNNGDGGGEQGHTSTLAESASHNHQGQWGGAGSGENLFAASNLGRVAKVSGNNTGTEGSDTAHNNVQPTITTNVIIKT